MVFFFFKQKTAYELRIRDWSSDVCSSDLRIAAGGKDGALHRRRGGNAQQHAARLSRPDNVDTGLIALHGKCRWRPAARQLLDTDSPARSGAYAASLRDINSVKSRTRSEERRVGKEWVSKCRSRW